MKQKYHVKNLDGQAIVERAGGRYFIVPDGADPAAFALMREGFDILERLDDIQEALEKMGAVDPERDPFGWRA